MSNTWKNSHSGWSGKVCPCFIPRCPCGFNGNKKVIEGNKYIILYDKTVSVKYVYDTLLRFKQQYLNENKIPKYKDEFELNLFNTFRSYLEKNIRPLSVDNYNDDSHITESRSLL